eukprot:5292577-Prymnesium_polylepis.1
MMKRVIVVSRLKPPPTSKRLQLVVLQVLLTLKTPRPCEASPCFCSPSVRQPDTALAHRGSLFSRAPCLPTYGRLVSAVGGSKEVRLATTVQALAHTRARPGTALVEL